MFELFSFLSVKSAWGLCAHLITTLSSARSRSRSAKNAIKREPGCSLNSIPTSSRPTRCHTPWGWTSQKPQQSLQQCSTWHGGTTRSRKQTFHLLTSLQKRSMNITVTYWTSTTNARQTLQQNRSTPKLRALEGLWEEWLTKSFFFSGSQGFMLAPTNFPLSH